MNPLRNRTCGSISEENLGPIAGERTLDDLREIECAASKILLQRARYPEHLERMTGR